MQNSTSYKVVVWYCCIGMSCRHQKCPKFLFTGEAAQTTSAPLGAVAVMSEKVGVVAFQLESSSWGIPQSEEIMKGSVYNGFPHTMHRKRRCERNDSQKSGVWAWNMYKAQACRKKKKDYWHLLAFSNSSTVYNQTKKAFCSCDVLCLDYCWQKPLSILFTWWWRLPICSTAC